MVFGKNNDLRKIQFCVRKSRCLLYFLLQFIKNRRAEKLAEGHVQTVAKLLDDIYGDFLASFIHHTVNCGRRNAGKVGEFITAILFEVALLLEYQFLPYVRAFPAGTTSWLHSLT